MTVLEELKLRLGELEEDFTDVELEDFIQSAMTSHQIDEVIDSNRSLIIDTTHLYILRSVLSNFDNYYSFRRADSSFDRGEIYRNLLQFYTKLDYEIRCKYPGKLSSIGMECD